MKPLPPALLEFLAGLPDARPRGDELGAGEAQTREIAQDADPLAIFTIAARRAGWNVHLPADGNPLVVAVEILRRLGVRSVLIETPTDALLHPPTAPMLAALPDALRSAGIAPLRSADDATLFDVDAGLTVADAAVAETGSVVCTTRGGASRRVSLVPPILLVLLPIARIVPDLYDLLASGAPTPGNSAADGAGMPASVTLITGPSKTADIEGVIVTGVHGPGQVHVVLL